MIQTRKTVTYAAALALAFGPVVAFAVPITTCGGFPIIGPQGTLATQMTHIMVCDPQGASPGQFAAQEWHSGTGTIQEFSDLARNNISYIVGQDGNNFGTISYSYGGANTPQYVVAVSGSTMFFCLDDGSGVAQYTTSFKFASTPTACP